MRTATDEYGLKRDPGSDAFIVVALVSKNISCCLTLSLGREDDHFMFISMVRYQFKGLLKEEKPDGHRSAEKGSMGIPPCFWFY